MSRRSGAARAAAARRRELVRDTPDAGVRPGLASALGLDRDDRPRLPLGDHDPKTCDVGGCPICLDNQGAA